jgi:hypothetical protein
MVHSEKPTHTPCGSWPNWRDAVHYRLGYLQATVDIHKMQQQSPPRSGDGVLRRILDRAKVWKERYELISWLWARGRLLGSIVSIALWWEQLLWLVRLIVG